MKKICVLQNGLARGGTDTFVVNLCLNLDKTKYKVSVVNPSEKATSRVREKELLENGIEIIKTCECNNFVNKIKHLYRLYRVLKKRHFDVFHTNIDLFNGPNLFVAWLAGVPIRCCHSHNTKQQREIIYGRSITVKIYQKVMRWLCWTFSNRRIGCSADAMDFLFAGKPWRLEEYPKIISNGIDIGKFRKKIDVIHKKSELNLNAKFNIILIRNLIPQKNSIFAVDVFNKLCSMREDCDLVIVGDGVLRKSCERHLSKERNLTKTHFLGIREDVNELLQCADLFFLPSVFEGLGIVAIEAQATGLQCVLSDAFPKEVDCGGCLFVPLSEPVDVWANKISELLDKEYEMLVDESKIQKYSISEMVKQMSEVFDYC